MQSISNPESEGYPFLATQYIHTAGINSGPPLYQDCSFKHISHGIVSTTFSSYQEAQTQGPVGRLTRPVWLADFLMERGLYF